MTSRSGWTGIHPSSRWIRSELAMSAGGRRAALRGPHRNLAAGHACDGVDHLPHRVPPSAAPEIVGPADAPLGQGVHRQDVCPRQILHVDVVADAGPVRSGVVGTEYGDEGQTAVGHLEREWDQVRFRIVVLAVSGRRSRSVEIPQAGRTQPVCAGVPTESMLERQFGLAIRVGWGESDRSRRSAAVRGRRTRRLSTRTPAATHPHPAWRRAETARRSCCCRSSAPDR